MDYGRDDVAVHAYVPGVDSLRVVDWPLEDAVVVVVPVELVQNAIVVVVVGVGPVAAIEPLD